MGQGAQVFRFPVQREAPVQVAPEPWVSKQTAAAYFEVDTRTIDRWVSRGLPQRSAWDYIDGRRRFKLSLMESWLRVQGNGRHIPG